MHGYVIRKRTATTQSSTKVWTLSPVGSAAPGIPRAPIDPRLNDSPNDSRRSASDATTGSNAHFRAYLTRQWLPGKKLPWPPAPTAATSTRPSATS